MVIVDPNGITLLVCLDNAVGNALVHGFVQFPRVVLVSLGFGVVRNLVMQSWPQNLLTVVVVVAL